MPEAELEIVHVYFEYLTEVVDGFAGQRGGYRRERGLRRGRGTGAAWDR